MDKDISLIISCTILDQEITPRGSLSVILEQEVMNLLPAPSYIVTKISTVLIRKAQLGSRRCLKAIK